MDIVKDIIKTLPPQINYEGALFRFSIFLNGSNMVCCYKLFMCLSDSKHLEFFEETGGSWKNPFFNGNRNDVLMAEYFTDTAELKQIVSEFKDFIKTNKLDKKT